jgi:hypothetical protein
MKLIYGAMKGMGDTCKGNIFLNQILGIKLNGNLGKKMT